MQYPMSQTYKKYKKYKHKYKQVAGSAQLGVCTQITEEQIRRELTKGRPGLYVPTKQEIGEGTNAKVQLFTFNKRACQESEYNTRHGDDSELTTCDCLEDLYPV